PRFPLRGVVAGRLSRRRPRPDRAGHQPGRRLAPRRPRPQAPGVDGDATPARATVFIHRRRTLPMRISRFPAALTALLALVAASGGLPRAEAQDRARAKDVIVAFAAEPRSLLPNTIVDWTTNIQVEHMYDRLVDRDAKSYKPIPMLATGWKVVNETTWEFTLRQGVKFHNGEPFNAASVKATMDYIKDPASKSH